MCRKAPLLSIIVPVYRCEATLDRCVESVLAQDFACWELLLVDDGSPDASGALCDAWAARDGRIRAIHQPNQGASAARNTGLEQARGRYIEFLDSDDALFPGLFSAAVPAMETGLDLYLFCLRRRSDGGAYLPPVTGRFAFPAALKPWLRELTIGSGHFDSPCNKLFRQSVIGALRFDPMLQVNEDVKFNLEYLARCGALELTGNIFYDQDDTVTGSLSRRMRTDYLDAEEATRSAYRAFLAAAGCGDEEAQALVERRRAEACRIQFGILTGRMSGAAFGVQKRLFAQIFAFAPGRTLLLQQLSEDPNRLQAAVIAFCVKRRLPGALSLLCRAKNMLYR